MLQRKEHQKIHSSHVINAWGNKGGAGNPKWNSFLLEIRPTNFNGWVMGSKIPVKTRQRIPQSSMGHL